MNSHTNIKYMHVTKKDTAAASTNAVKSVSDLRVGETALIDPTGARVTTLDATALKTGFKVVQNDGGVLKYSPLVNTRSVTGCQKKEYAPFIRQVSFLGYNGTSGDIFVDNYTDYRLRIRFKENISGQFDTALIAGGYASDANATSAEIADNQIQTMVLNTNDSKKKPVKVARVGSHNATLIAFANATTAKILKFSKNSNVVSILQSDLTAGAADVVEDRYISVPSESGNKFTIAGNITGTIYIGTIGYAGTSATTFAASINAGTQATAVVSANNVIITLINQTEVLPPVSVVTTGGATAVASITTGFGETVPTLYKISTGGTGVSSFVLDAPYQGSDCYAVVGTVKGSNVQYTSVSGSVYEEPSAFGLKVTAISKNYSPNRIVREGTSFQIEATGYSTTKITYAIAPNEGSGDWGKVTDLFIFAQAEGKNGSQYQNDRYSTIQFAEQYEAYDMYTINRSEGSGGRVISQNSTLDSEIIIAIPTAAHRASGDANDTLNTQLTALIALL